MTPVFAGVRRWHDDINSASGEDLAMDWLAIARIAGRPARISATWSTSILKVAGSTSTNTGLAPRCSTTLAVDTQVIDRDGQPIGNLSPRNFEVWINGRARQVVSADLIQYPMPAPRSLLPSGIEARNPRFEVGLPEVTGRVLVIAIDELSFSTSAMPAVLQTIRRFLATVPADDVVGLYAYPLGPAKLDLTHYHSQIGVALGRIQGLRDTYNSGEFQLSAAEAMDISANDAQAFQRVYDRNCKVAVKGGCQVVDSSCGSRLRAEGNAYAMYLEQVSVASYGGVRDLLRGLSGISGPKTVMLLSAGVMTTDRTGGRPDMTLMMSVAGKFAAAANAPTKLGRS
jgi:hypothetical protein